MRRATRLMLSASATEEPPYFCTTKPTVSSGTTRTDCADESSQRRSGRAGGARMRDARLAAEPRRRGRVALRSRAMTLRPAVIELVVSDMAASVAFYRRLGLELPEDATDAPHVEIDLGGACKLALDTVRRPSAASTRAGRRRPAATASRWRSPATARRTSTSAYRRLTDAGVRRAPGAVRRLLGSAVRRGARPRRQAGRPVRDSTRPAEQRRPPDRSGCRSGDRDRS